MSYIEDYMKDEEECKCGTSLEDDAFLGDKSTGICSKCAEKKILKQLNNDNIR